MKETIIFSAMMRKFDENLRLRKIIGILAHIIKNVRLLIRQ